MGGRLVFAAAIALGVCGCAPAGVASGPPTPGAIAGNFQALGTEPFWSVEAAGARMTYATPEHPARPVGQVARSEGGGESRFAGTLAGEPFVLIIRPGACSDGMSDRSYAYTARLRVGARQVNGCAAAR